MLAHDGFDAFRRFVCVVEWNGADVMVKDMCLDNSVEELSANEAKFAIDGGGSSSGIGPRRWGVVRQRGISVL